MRRSTDQQERQEETKGRICGALSKLKGPRSSKITSRIATKRKSKELPTKLRGGLSLRRRSRPKLTRNLRNSKKSSWNCLRITRSKLMTQSNKLIKSSRTSKFRESRPKRMSSKSSRSQLQTLAHLTRASRRTRPTDAVTTSTRTLMTSPLRNPRKDGNLGSAGKEIGGTGRDVSTERSRKLRKVDLTRITRSCTIAL